MWLGAVPCVAGCVVGVIFSFFLLFWWRRRGACAVCERVAA